MCLIARETKNEGIMSSDIYKLSFIYRQWSFLIENDKTINDKASCSTDL